MLKVNIKTNVDKKLNKIRCNIESLQPKYLNEIAKYVLDISTSYVPRDKGTLRKSGKANNNYVLWNTPYARRQYYEHKTDAGWVNNAIQANRKEFAKMCNKYTVKEINNAKKSSS